MRRRLVRELRMEEEMKKINTRFQEIIRLDDMLDEANICHGFHRLFDGFQVIYCKDGKQIADVIEHSYSYGSVADKLEIMGLLTPEEEAVDNVKGWLTAEEVFARIEKHWNGGVDGGEECTCKADG